MSSKYQIRVRGELDPRFSDWFDGFSIDHTPDGDTLLSGMVVDQAALYGLLARCRDLGLTLISLNPISAVHQQEQKMSTIHVEFSQVIDATPEEIHAVVADYRVGHPAILPKPYFSDLTIEQGGFGAGTVIRFYVQVMGRKYPYHQRVTEPVPGRKIVETDIETGQFSSFTFEPVNARQTRVTIQIDTPASPGLMGVLERLTQAAFSRRLLNIELQQLANYVKSQRTAAVPAR